MLKTLIPARHITEVNKIILCFQGIILFWLTSGIGAEYSASSQSVAEAALADGSKLILSKLLRDGRRYQTLTLQYKGGQQILFEIPLDQNLSLQGSDLGQPVEYYAIRSAVKFGNIVECILVESSFAVVLRADLNDPKGTRQLFIIKLSYPEQTFEFLDSNLLRVLEPNLNEPVVYRWAANGGMEVVSEQISRGEVSKGAKRSLSEHAALPQSEWGVENGNGIISEMIPSHSHSNRTIVLIAMAVAVLATVWILRSRGRGNSP